MLHITSFSKFISIFGMFLVLIVESRPCFENGTIRMEFDSYICPIELIDTGDSCEAFGPRRPGIIDVPLTCPKCYALQGTKCHKRRGCFIKKKV